MPSGAARREQIQLELQLLRERQAREREAFDAVAAAHPELSAAEVSALALRTAEAATPQTIDVDGVSVRVGDRVAVRDDLALLHRADRGYFAPDVLKPIYLGERGAVVRVMACFQGKPAVELKFADGVSKVFFTECLAVDAAPAPSSSAAGRRVDVSEVPIFVPPTKVAPPPPRAETLPGWGQLAMPHRRAADRASGAGAAASASPPPPPATVAALRTSGTPSAPAAAAGVAPVRRTASKSRPSPSPAAPAGDAGGAAAKDTPSSPSPPPSPQPASSGAPAVTLMKKSPVRRTKAASSASASSTSIPVIKRPSADGTSSPPHRAAAAAHIDAAAPTPLSPECIESSSSSRESAPAVEMETEKGTSSGAAAVDASEVPAPDPQQPEGHVAAAAVEHAMTGSLAPHVPEAGAATYQAKYELQDDVSRIPRRQSVASSTGTTGPTTTPTSGTRACWVCGLLREDAVLTEPARVAFSAQCTTMFSLFAVLTRRLHWDKEQRTASRLFNEKGTELKTAAAVRDGMRLVATAGCDYRPGAHADAFRSVPEGRPPAVSPKARQPDTKKPTATTAATVTAVSAGAAPPASPSATKSTLVMQRRASTTAAAPPAPLHRNPIAASPASRKPRHIRVYENGLYDDNVYRTVTIRPTYKTLVALKATITRELQWRDGKRVDLLFDACGADITDLDAISDGDVVVASAGDRFMVPYPNTPMHQEAMKLSERLNPARKC